MFEILLNSDVKTAEESSAWTSYSMCWRRKRTDYALATIILYLFYISSIIEMKYHWWHRAEHERIQRCQLINLVLPRYHHLLFFKQHYLLHEYFLGFFHIHVDHIVEDGLPIVYDFDVHYVGTRWTNIMLIM